MARREAGFRGAKLVGVELDATSVQVAADAPSEVEAGTLQEVIADLAARVKALEDAA